MDDDDDDDDRNSSKKENEKEDAARTVSTTAVAVGRAPGRVGSANGRRPHPSARQEEVTAPIIFTTSRKRGQATECNYRRPRRRRPPIYQRDINVFPRHRQFINQNNKNKR